MIWGGDGMNVLLKLAVSSPAAGYEYYTYIIIFFNSVKFNNIVYWQVEGSRVDIL